MLFPEIGRFGDPANSVQIGPMRSHRRGNRPAVCRRRQTLSAGMQWEEIRIRAREHHSCQRI